MVQVVVSKVDLPARTDLDQLIKDDQFRIIQVPEGVVVDGAVTSLDQLAGKSNGVAILAGEQIPVARISGNVPGGALAIPNGMEAITVSLDASRGVAGCDQLRRPCDDLLHLQGRSDQGRGRRRPSPLSSFPRPSCWRCSVRSRAPRSAATRRSQPSEQLPGSLTVTVALTPEDAQHFVFSMESGTVWFGLLPPDENGQPMEPITFAQVVK